MAEQLKRFDLRNDFIFKLYFRDKETRGIMARFLSAITGISKDKFLNADYVTEELPPIREEERKKTTDIIVKIGPKRCIIIEMNKKYYKDAFEVNTSYAMEMILHNTEHGEEYSGKSVILINIDNFNHYKTDKPILNFKIRDEDGIIENELYNSIHLILENVHNHKYNIDKEIEKFVRLLVNQKDYSELRKEFKGDKDYMAGIVKLEDLAKDIDKVGLLYDVEEQHEREIIGSYRWGREEEKRENAINLYKKGLSKEFISDALNITEEQLEEYLMLEEK